MGLVNYCYRCKERYPGCHGKCEKYRIYKEKLAQAKSEKSEFEVNHYGISHRKGKHLKQERGSNLAEYKNNKRRQDYE